MTRLNRAMAELLSRFRIEPSDPPPLEAELRRLLDPGLVNFEGCWLLASQVSDGAGSKLNQFPDRTGCEAFVNHVHVTDVLGGDAERSPERSLAQAVAFGHALEALVTPRGAFQIVVATSKDAPGDCNVRFYRVRPGEVWIESDLEGYTEEGILVIETPEPDRPAGHGQ